MAKSQKHDEICKFNPAQNILDTLCHSPVNSSATATQDNPNGNNATKSLHLCKKKPFNTQS